MNKHKIILSFGSNLGDRKKNILQSIKLLEARDLIEVDAISSFLQNKALLIEGSPKEWDIDFYNLVLSGYTKHSPAYIIAEIDKIESEIGRKSKRKKWAPREIDIDILFYNNLCIDGKISIPHKEFINRPFLIALMNEIEPNYIYPDKGKFEGWKISEICQVIKYEET